ncbi:MAG: threonylcarbamoyl-AMP synthase [Bryobacterales bacterium]|nr:threonylcarbamoyl-AMP synthase [Bryobacterales bacterium]
MVKTTSVSEAAAAIRAGKLVAFPTETVYGLGANALDAAAVGRIFEAKGRPVTSPLIVHVDSVAMARNLTVEWPESAEKLAAAFWPGPLTLVLSKAAAVPDIVTAGLPTVGLRMPSHPVALALIREAGVPIAAPSANRFSCLSPTSSAHVADAMGGQVDVLLEGGPSTVGIESAVLSLAWPVPRLLRPGMVTRAEIEVVIGPVEAGGGAGEVAGDNVAHPSPGMHPKHYSPRTPLLLGAPRSEGRGAYVFVEERSVETSAVVQIRMPGEAWAYAAVLYETLHALDRQSLDWIAVEPPPSGPEWEGVWDRLTRGAA